MRFLVNVIRLSLCSIVLISAFNSPPLSPNKLVQIQLPHTTKLQTSISSSTEAEKNIFNIFETLDDLYTQSSRTIKCPFFRRRAADLIDGFAMVLRFLMIRHKSLYGFDDFDAFMIMSTPPGCRSATANGKRCTSDKVKGLDVDKLYDIILHDWTNNKREISGTTATIKHYHHVGYYITGKLNTTIYRDDCLFEGPDPDMPVRGLRKYLSAASKLFHHKQSYADLLDLQIIENKIIAHWRIQGILMLPWHPKIKPYTGKTEYHIDEDGLIYLHKEKWDISVIQAFVQTMWPEFANRIWSMDNDRIDLSLVND